MTAIDPVGIKPVRSTQLSDESLLYAADLAGRISNDLRSLASGRKFGVLDRHSVYQGLVDVGYDTAELSALTTGLRRDTQAVGG